MQPFKWLYTVTLLSLCAAETYPKQVLVTYPNDIPSVELNNQREKIREAGGEILHEYHLIKGFIVKISNEAYHKMTDFFATREVKFQPVIELDQKVEIQKD